MRATDWQPRRNQVEGRGDKELTDTKRSQVDWKRRKARIALLLAEGKQPGEIAGEVGLAVHYTREIIRTDPILRAAYQENRKREVPIGPIGPMTPTVRAQPVEFQEWIARTKPEGTTLAEFLVSFAVDAFHEETDSETTTQT
jgi:hypothetical protein